MNEHVAIVALISTTVLTLAVLAYRFDWATLPRTRDALERSTMQSTVIDLQHLITELVRRVRELETGEREREDQTARLTAKIDADVLRLEAGLERAAEERTRLIQAQPARRIQ